MNEEMFPNQDDQVLGPGKLLQIAREEKNLRPEDVAYEIRLTPSQVLALEENDYTRMPEETYVRGYLRNYAKLVGVPENDILMAFARLTRKSEKKPQQVSPSGDNDIHKSGNGIRLLAIFIIVAVVALSAVWVLEPLDKLSLSGESEKTATPIAEESTVATAVPVGASKISLDKPVENPQEETTVLTTITTEPMVETVSTSSMTATVPEPAAPVQQQTGPDSTDQIMTETQVLLTAPVQSGGEVDTAETAIADTTTVTEPESTPQASGEGTLIISYSKDSWTDIRDANGQKLLYRTVKKGEKIALAGKLPMSLFFGFAQGVKVTFNGEEIDVAGYTRGVFARFSVGESVNP